MASGFLARFRPTGPWRFGPDSGRRDRVDLIYHSDSMYSAVTSAMAQLGKLEEWIAATAGNPRESEVRFSSCYPFQNATLFIVPPKSHWPPPASTKVRFKGSRFVPLRLAQDLLADKPIEEERWHADGESECLLPVERRHSGGPFRKALRSSAAVDRLTGDIEAHATACLEFAPEAGLWMAAAFASVEAKERWSMPVQSALRLLADSGFGGERSRGWGRAETPEFSEGQLPELLWKRRDDAPDAEGGGEPGETAYWLLSTFIPAEDDAIDWKRGSYTTMLRSGRIESPGGWGEMKVASPMVAEGSVLVAANAPRGVARNVAPDNFPHPVFRAGFALTMPIPWRNAS